MSKPLAKLGPGGDYICTIDEENVTPCYDVMAGIGDIIGAAMVLGTVLVFILVLAATGGGS